MFIVYIFLFYFFYSILNTEKVSFERTTYLGRIFNVTLEKNIYI